MNICERIRKARGRNVTRCAIVEGRMTQMEAARRFALADSERVYRKIARAAADAIAIHALHVDLAYGTKILSIHSATELWRQFMLGFDGQDVTLMTNIGPMDKLEPTPPYTWTPATTATLDMGVLVIGATKAGLLWVLGED